MCAAVITEYLNRACAGKRRPPTLRALHTYAHPAVVHNAPSCCARRSHERFISPTTIAILVHARRHMAVGFGRPAVQLAPHLQAHSQLRQHEQQCVHHALVNRVHGCRERSGSEPHRGGCAQQGRQLRHLAGEPAVCFAFAPSHTHVPTRMKATRLHFLPICCFADRRRARCCLSSLQVRRLAQVAPAVLRLGVLPRPARRQHLPHRGHVSLRSAAIRVRHTIQ